MLLQLKIAATANMESTSPNPKASFADILKFFNIP